MSTVESVDRIEPARLEDVPVTITDDVDTVGEFYLVIVGRQTEGFAPSAPKQIRNFRLNR
jgi:hypothetical protein